MNSFSKLQLMELHINTLFQSGDDGRLRFTNETNPPLAPRVYFGRTPEGNRWRFRYDLPDDLCAQLDALCRAEPIADDFQTAHQNADAIRAHLHAHAPIQQEYRGPAWWIPHTPALNQAQASHHTVLLNAHNLELTRTHFAWVLSEKPHLIGPVAATMMQDKAVALCFCSRIPGGAAEAGVETALKWRGRGYASAVVARWAQAMYEVGYLPLYSTSWDNLASQRIASKLGMKFYGEDWSVL